jgi:hypothetical protein
MNLHRVIRLICLIGASVAPIFAAYMCRFVSRTMAPLIVPRVYSDQLPSLTKTWIVGMANDSFPLLLDAFGVSMLIVTAGFYFFFAKRLPAEASSSGLVLVCCVGYTAGLIALGSTLMALVMPFLPKGTI